MGRCVAAIAVLALLIGAVGAGWAPGPVDAQDTTEDRLAALETRVAEQGETIDGHSREIERLEDRVDELEGDDDGTGAGAASGGNGAGDGRDAGAGVNLTFEGTTDAISEPFTVSAGTLRFDAVYSGNSNFIVSIYDAAGNWDLVFNEIGPYQGQRVIQVAGPGDFAIGVTAGEVFLELQGIGQWTIAVTQER